jgi:UvrD-like helicase C-terminal domain/AAA domain/Nuclease-related domain
VARMVPDLDEARLEALKSSAEADFYRACRDQLDNQVLVIHSLALVRLTAAGSREDAEADFVIIDPRHGLLVVEVKGGGIEFDPLKGMWTSVGRDGLNEIKDPFRQASDQKHAIIDFFKESPRWKAIGGGRVLCGHAVFFPDVHQADQLKLPSSPKQILGGLPEMKDLSHWIRSVFDYWGGTDPRNAPPGSAGLAFFETLLCKPVLVRPLLSRELALEEEKRIELTRQQARLLRAIGMRRRAMICGGAGTGKTLLALERAREMARGELRTLLVCYNRALGDHLKAAAQGIDNLYVMTFHQLCDWRTGVALTETGKDLLAEARDAFPGADHYAAHLPMALTLAIEETALRYDAIIVDEAQDFTAEFWLPIEMLLTDPGTSHLYAFADHNQVFYAHSAKPPISEDAFLLTMNCRNTRIIHDAAYRYYAGAATEAPSIGGAPIEVLVANSIDAQATRIAAAVTKLIMDEQMAPEDIAILVVRDSKQPLYDALRGKPLPRGALWGVERHRTAATVVVDTVPRFKGLEAAIVFLCGMETVSDELDRELVYVGLSRAKSRVILVGSRRATLELSGPADQP